VFEGVPPPYDRTKRMVIPDVLKYTLSFYPSLSLMADLICSVLMNFVWLLVD
jgi:hypothetical protein